MRHESWSKKRRSRRGGGREDRSEERKWWTVSWGKEKRGKEEEREKQGGRGSGSYLRGTVGATMTWNTPCPWNARRHFSHRLIDYLVPSSCTPWPTSRSSRSFHYLCLFAWEHFLFPSPHFAHLPFPLVSLCPPRPSFRITSFAPPPIRLSSHPYTKPLQGGGGEPPGHDGAHVRRHHAQSGHVQGCLWKRKREEEEEGKRRGKVREESIRSWHLM